MKIHFSKHDSWGNIGYLCRVDSFNLNPEYATPYEEEITCKKCKKLLKLIERKDKKQGKL
jgi:hypothetical protein